MGGKDQAPPVTSWAWGRAHGPHPAGLFYLRMQCCAALCSRSLFRHPPPARPPHAAPRGRRPGPRKDSKIVGQEQIAARRRPHTGSWSERATEPPGRRESGRWCEPRCGQQRRGGMGGRAFMHAGAYSRRSRVRSGPRPAAWAAALPAGYARGSALGPMWRIAAAGRAAAAREAHARERCIPLHGAACTATQPARAAIVYRINGRRHTRLSMPYTATEPARAAAPGRQHHHHPRRAGGSERSEQDDFAPA